MSQIGKAYLEILADLKKFPADLRTKLKAALKEGLAGVEFTGLDEKATKAGDQAAEHLGRGFEEKAKRRFVKAGEEGGRGILSGLRKIFSRGSSEGGGFLSSIGGFFGNIFSSIKDAVSSAGQQATSAGGGALSGLGGILGGGGDIGGVLKVGAIATLIPVALGAAGALLQLSAALFALPAAVSVGAAAIIPLVVAFQGFGEAVGAGLSGDTAKFNEALKGLAPSARSVVKEVVGLKSVFSGVKQTIQQEFFAPLVGQVGPAIGGLLRSVQGGLGTVSRTLGGLARNVLQAFSSPQAIATFRDVLASTSRIVAGFGSSLPGLITGFLGVIRVGLPFVERFFGFLSGGLAQFGGWLERVSKDGRLNAWLERAADIGQKLWDVIKGLGEFLFTVLNSFGSEGTDTIRGLGDAFKHLNEFMKSKDGQEALHNLGVLVHWAGNALVDFVDNLDAAFTVLNVIFDAVRLLGRGLQFLGGAVWVAIKAVGQFFSSAWDWLKGAGAAIGRFFTEDIPRWFGQIVDWFKSLPGKIFDGLNSGSDQARNWLGDLLKGWYSALLEWLGQIIGTLLALPQTLPRALDQLGQMLSGAWDAAWSWVVNAVSASVDWLVAFWFAIPGRLSAAGEAIWNWAKDTWTRVSDSVTGLVSSGIDKVVNFFEGIPGRIRAIGPAVLEAAKSIGHKIADGLTEIGNFASDLGRKVTNALKDGINWVIDSINRGINDIDERLPGTLPRIPKLARGAIVDSPTLALVGEAGPEVVVPLSNPGRARELAQQSGLLGLLSRGAQTVVNVVAYLDPSGVIIPTVKTIVNGTFDDQGDALPYARAA